MNPALIEQAINSYKTMLPPSTQKRLEFFKGLWMVQKGIEEKAKFTHNYEMPSAETFNNWYWDEKPLLMLRPLTIEPALMFMSLKECAKYIVEKGGLSKPAAALIENFDWQRLIEEVGLQEAGYEPGFWIAKAAAAATPPAPSAHCTPSAPATDANALAPNASLLGIVIAYAVRPLLEPISEQALELYRPNKQRYESHVKPLRCPVCGGKAGLAQVGNSPSSDGAGRMLYCTCCGANWEFERIRCARCGTQNQGKLHYFHVEDDPAHRLYICDECSSYVRTSFLFELKVPFCMDVEDVVMARLDHIAHHAHLKSNRIN